MHNSGFGNFHQSEISSGLLPANQNSPQQCAEGLYPEQINGSAFTRSRHLNFKSWLYRRLPSVARNDFELYSEHSVFHCSAPLPPNPLRWSPISPTNERKDFVDALFPFAQTLTNTVFLYQFQVNDENRYFNNLDGEMLIVPYLGSLNIITEFGPLDVSPGCIAVIPRGVYCKIMTIDSLAAGYICENRSTPLSIPSLGVIGANGLANPRHFRYPSAALEDESIDDACLINKYQGALWISEHNSSPLNVAAWQGNYAPYRYDLSLFNTINTVSFDHPDPSIYTVLNSESELPGIANLDFVIFPSRWMVAEHSFRPPYFHRNVMSELMGLIKGSYDAKEEGFLPGGVSVHNAMCPHGPDVASTEKAMNAELKPEYFDDGLAFMFESKDLWNISNAAYQHPSRQLNYTDCWQGFIKANV